MRSRIGRALHITVVTLSIAVVGVAAVGGWLYYQDLKLLEELKTLESEHTGALTQKFEQASDPKTLASYLYSPAYFDDFFHPFLSKAFSLYFKNHRSQAFHGYEEKMGSTSTTLLKQAFERHDGKILADIEKLRGIVHGEQQPVEQQAGATIQTHLKIIELSEDLSDAALASSIIKQHFYEMARAASQKDRAMLSGMFQKGNLLYRNLKQDVAKAPTSTKLENLLLSPMFYSRYARPFIDEALSIQNRPLREKLIHTFQNKLYQTAFYYYGQRVSELRTKTVSKARKHARQPLGPQPAAIAPSSPAKALPSKVDHQNTEPLQIISD